MPPLTCEPTILHLLPPAPESLTPQFLSYKSTGAKGTPVLRRAHAARAAITAKPDPTREFNGRVPVVCCSTCASSDIPHSHSMDGIYRALAVTAVDHS